MGTRKMFGPHRREKKFFIVGTMGAGQDYWTYYSQLRFVTSDPRKAKRFYSKKSYMVRKALKVVETEKGMDVYVPTKPTIRNPAPSPASRSAKLHKIRTLFVKDMKAAKRNGNRIREDLMIRKILKLDRMLYAPRIIKRRK